LWFGLTPTHKGEVHLLPHTHTHQKQNEQLKLKCVFIYTTTAPDSYQETILKKPRKREKLKSARNNRDK
jgi:hypothetical protein